MSTHCYISATWKNGLERKRRFDHGIIYTGLDKQKKISVKLLKNFLPIFLVYVLGAQKNRLIETVLLSTQNICFG